MSAALAVVTHGRAWLERHVGGGEDRVKAARRMAVVSGGVVLVCALALLVDYGVGVWSGAGQTARIVELEEQTKEDPEAAAALHEERKGQTDGSLAREARGRALAWALLVAGGVFVGAGKWWVSLRPQRVPSLEELVAVRFGGGAVVGVREGSAGRKQGEQGAGAEVVAAAGARGEGRGNVAHEATGQNDRFAREQGRGNVAAELADLGFVDGLITQFGRDKESAIPILQAIQSHYRYLPDEALRYVCERTEITPAQIAGTSSFYSQFRRSPVGRHVVRVCHGTACHVAGADQITEELRRHLEIPPGEDTDAQRLFTLDKVACVGCCSLAPVMMVEEETAGRLTPATARQALDAVARKA